jgi:GR25 family glycosyltransferase involved in LPS biosynthesis
MKAYVITLKGNDYSEQAADRCIASAKKYGVDVEKFYGVDKTHSQEVMESFGLKWTWANNNTKAENCPISGLYTFPYTSSSGSLAALGSKIGCSMSHYLLWKKSVDLDEPILILEHDAVFVRPLPKIDFTGICQINDPTGATPRGGWWSQQMKNRGVDGVFEKTWIRKPNERHIPDGLAGNSAYMVKPWAAQELINKYHELGVWPNDATICKQLFSYLEEYYPFITIVKQTKSTSVE